MTKIYTSRGVTLEKKVVGGEATFLIDDIIANGGSDLKSALVDVCKQKGVDETSTWQAVDELCADINTIINNAQKSIASAFLRPFPNTGDRYDAIVKSVFLNGGVKVEYFIPYWEERMYDYDQNGKVVHGEVVKPYQDSSGNNGNVNNEEIPVL
jgi:hypothetical protein